jgi:hypothetical protein
MRLRHKQVDALVLVALLVGATVYGLVTKGTWWNSGLIVGAAFLIPPVVYLGMRKKKNWSKIAVATVVFGGLFAFIFDFLAEYTHAWTTVSILFPKVIGGTIDNMGGFLMMTVLTVVFYEHFVATEKDPHLSRNLKYAVLPGLFILVAMLAAYKYKPDLLQVRYPYVVLGILAVIPTVAIALFKPKIFQRMLSCSVYFFVLYLVIELFAVGNRYWIYDGEYIGWVSLVNLHFPLEELFFWMLLYSSTLIAYYELFVDTEILGAPVPKRKPKTGRLQLARIAQRVRVK